MSASQLTPASCLNWLHHDKQCFLKISQQLAHEPIRQQRTVGSHFYKMQITHTQSKILISHSAANILHLKILNPYLLVTASSDGELRLYRTGVPNDQQYHSIDCNKLFDCPIVACDVAEDGSIVAAGFSGHLKICKIVDSAHITVQNEIKLAVDSPIVSCVWSWRRGEILVSSELGTIYAVGGENSVIYEGRKGKENLVFLRRGNDRIYMSQGSKIESFHNYIIGNTFNKRTELTLHAPILDFTISNEPLFTTLAVLTQHSLSFYLIHSQPLQTAVFEVDEKAIGSRLGWGVSCDQLALYQCVDGSIKMQQFIRLLSGKWKKGQNGVQLVSQTGSLETKMCDN